MDRKQMEASLKEIHHLLSHLHGEVTVLESSYTQLLQVLRNFEGAAHFDDLTGLLRRREFFRKWEALLKECERLNEGCGVLMVDIDHFKQVNDVHGHSVGDMVLRALAGTLQTKLRRVDIVGRLGGEEFGILLPHTDAEAAGRVVDRLRIEFGSQSFEAAAGGFGVTFSAGITSNSVFDNEMLEMINGADESLYEAKRQGRNCVVIHEACLRRMSATP